ncbi:hypothetical protein BT93_K2295 [Corymbia citriodora subsp. variegata]|nr:hypothetical protein BT93_K2295 [Corymbia citriodora subsp. variegata]KAF8008581.1 hypothetical protein BT93_K2295 [Corymbia citriodora subsp. variegata]
MMMSSLLPTTYKNLVLYASLSLSLSLLLSFLRLPVLFLRGLFTYIHPENLGAGAGQNASPSGLRAAIRRPGSDPGSGLNGFQTLSSATNAELRKKGRSKDRFEFDENNAQIFRLKLDEAHLESRIYFGEYGSVFALSLVGVSGAALNLYLGGGPEGDGVLADGSLIPVLFGFVAVSKWFLALAKVSFERSASRRSEKQLSLCFGVLGFIAGLLICSSLARSSLDFDLGAVDGLCAVLIAGSMGCLAGYLYVPGMKSARAFWLGTDQIRSNLSIISCGWFARMVLFATYLLSIFTAFLWINPLSKMLINERLGDDKVGSLSGDGGDADRLLGNVGMSRLDFSKFRLWCLLISSVLQIVAFRSIFQMYLNEAVLSWYQRLHSSRVPDLDFSRAKVFLHNHYLCLTILQFLAPPSLVLLFLGLSQIEGNPFGKLNLLCGQLPCSAFLKQVALLMAWWVVFVWTVFTSVTLVLYRRGFLYVS